MSVRHADNGPGEVLGDAVEYPCHPVPMVRRASPLESVLEPAARTSDEPVATERSGLPVQLDLQLGLAFLELQFHLEFNLVGHTELDL